MRLSNNTKTEGRRPVAQAIIRRPCTAGALIQIQAI